MNAYTMSQYQQNQIKTASPEQILLMLYDGAIRFTCRAIKGIEKNRPELRRSGVSKVMAIIVEFSNSLDHEIGGKIAEDLDALYSFMLRELSCVTMNNDLKKLETIKKLLLELRQTWIEAVELNKKKVIPKVVSSRGVSQSRPGTRHPAKGGQACVTASYTKGFQASI